MGEPIEGVSTADSSCEQNNPHEQDSGRERRLASRGVYRPYVVASARRAAAPPPLPDHRPQRPLWICAADGSPWPCGVARTQMVGVYGADWQALARRLLWLMAVAARDLGVLRPARLYRRFVAWALPKDARCRVCGRRRHDVIPGLPPRLFPCGEDAIPPIHPPRKRR